MEDATGRSPRPDLFSASLSAGPVEAGFSQRAAFFVAFLGGPFAALAFHAWNAKLWGRLAQDLPWLLAGLLLAAASVPAILVWKPALVAAGLPADFVRLLSRAMGLVLWGIFTLRHRALHRAQVLSQLEPRSPWVPGLVCGALALLVSLALGGATVLLGGPR
jgi:hypothetical protein